MREVPGRHTQSMTQRIQRAFSVARRAIAPLRYWRATLWTILIQYEVGDILWDASQPGKGGQGTDPSASFMLSVAFATYVAAVTFGHFGISAWLAARGKYSVFRALSLQISAVTVALLAFVPIYFVVANPSINNFLACTTLKCDILIPFGTAAICGGAALITIIPVSLLWFFLAKPKPPAATPAKPELNQARALTNRHARAYLLAVAMFCGGSIAIVEVLFSEYADGRAQGALGIAICLLFAFTGVTPLALPLLIPARWPGIFAWASRIGAMYAALLVLASYGAFQASEYIPSEYTGLHTQAMGAATLAMLGLAGSSGVLLWPDISRIRRRVGRYRRGSLSGMR